MAEDETANYFPPIAHYEMDFEPYLALNKSSWKATRRDAALIIYDMQSWYVERYEDASPLLGNITTLRDAARANEVPVIYVAAESVTHIAERGIAYDLWGPGIGAVKGAKASDHEMHPALTPREDEFVIRKRKYSAFFQTDLEDLLRRMNRNQLIISGNYAHHGCMVTAIDAYMRNFKVFYTADALGAFDVATHDMALRYVADLCGQIAITDQVVADISR